MRRATITLTREIEAALDAYLRQQEVPLALTAVVQTALNEFLTGRGFLPPARPFRITPARKGSGKKDISANHDRYLAAR